MKRVALPSVLFLALVLLPQSLFSSGISLTGSLGVESSAAFYSQIVPGVSLMWRADSFGVGVEVDLPVDPFQGDAYLVGLFFCNFGWFRIGAGASAMLMPPANGPYFSPPSLYPVIRVGLAGPISKVGPGAIGFDLFVEIFATALPGSGWTGVLLGANALKAGIGLSYSVPF